MEELEGCLTKFFIYGVYLIWGGVVIFGFYYYFAIMFSIMNEVGPFMAVFIFVFGIFFISPVLLTLIAMFKK